MPAPANWGRGKGSGMTAGVIALMGAASGWSDFKRRLELSLPKYPLVRLLGQAELAG